MAQKQDQEKELAVGRIFRKIKGSRSGLSLMEVIVALGLTAVVVPSLAQGLIVLIDHGDKAYDRSLLVELAQSQYESIQSETYQQNISLYAIISTPAGYSISLAKSLPGSYTYPAPASTATPETYQQIAITVTGVRGSFTLEGYKVKR